jgi:hypothetical protein
MDQVRPFVEDDIPQVADLHRRVFRTSAHPSEQLQAQYTRYFKQVFLNNPWYDKDLPSLVYETAQGAITGFLGVMPRWLSIKGRPIQAAVSSQFIVEPGPRSPVAAVQLAKAFLSGPQDLSLADEATTAIRSLWERAGGSTALLYSLSWGRFLRPSQVVLSRLAKQRPLKPLALALRPLAHLVDGMAVRMPGSPFRQVAPSLSGGDLSPETLLACMSEFTRDRVVRPVYDDRSLHWLLEVFAQRNGHGLFQKVILRNTEKEIVGWYLYYLNQEGIGEVVQIGAEKESIKSVLDHLFYHAWRHGAVALTGRIEPQFIQELSERSCIFHHREQWVLVHSNTPELLQAIHTGDAVLTRLEGELCMRFS